MIKERKRIAWLLFLGAAVLMPTPGHTPGHQSVFLKLAGYFAAQQDGGSNCACNVHQT